ncbi:DUF58 domain-containing protein [Nocardioides terrisoli]|uniref:DUF58 domain-containing protein n=1 Tax=Nocardioides terrisoli TaxID=3388267 RepID=UPI00287B6D3D|nr:DUF58 domain-containing protein [Nocardioides marmorisolisilvae]
MREALHSLTSRGRGFLAGGITAVLCGMLLGERDLVRIGILVLMLPLGTMVWMARARHEISLVRTLSTTQVEVGQPVAVRLSLTNLGPRTQLLMVEEQLPYALGSRPRFVVDPMQTGESVTLDYTVRSDVRGGYPIGPLRFRVGDPFGMLELRRTFSAIDHLVVTPRVETLPAIPMIGAYAGTGDNKPRSFVGGNAADVTVREYRLGDDLRRVHWPSTAHSGDLMVRREEQPWQARCTLLIDNRSRAHRGRGASSSLEPAIRAGASIALHLAGQGYQVRLVSAAGEELGHGWHDGEVALNTRSLLASLAVLPGLDAESLATDWVDEAVTSTLFVAVLGAVDERDRPFFARIGRVGGSTYGLALDVARWAGAHDAPVPATGWLRSIGWKAAQLGPDTPLRQAWQELTR